MVKHITIVEPVFGRNFRLVVGDYKSFAGLVKKELGFDIKDNNSANGRYLEIENNKTKQTFIYIWLEKFDGSITDIGILAHELHHHQYYFAKDCGVEDKEGLAYFYEYCLRESLKVLMPCNKKKKKKK